MNESQQTLANLIHHAVALVSEAGLRGLTYRQLAARASVSHALVTYYFPGKSRLLDAVTEAASAMSIEACALQVPYLTGDRSAAIPLPFLSEKASLAWAEIIVDAVISEERRPMVRNWFQRIVAMKSAQDQADPTVSDLLGATFADVTIGLNFIYFATGLDADAFQRLLLGDRQELKENARTFGHRVATSKPKGRKALATRAAIIESARHLFLEGGAAALSHKAIAERGGLSLTTPAYHFASIDQVFRELQANLIEASKDRYRSVMRTAGTAMTSFEGIVDVTAAVLIREATESAQENFAFFSTWLEAPRRGERDTTLPSFVLDQLSAWDRVFASALPKEEAGSINSLLAMALFTGKLIRLLATGSDISDLSQIRTELSRNFRAIALITSQMSQVDEQ